MKECPYTPEQVKEIEALDNLANEIQDFAAEITDDLSWVAPVLEIPQALKENAFEGLGAHALEEAELMNPLDMDAQLARAEFVSYLQVISAFQDNKEALRRTFVSDNWRFADLIYRMAECAGLYKNMENITFDEDKWTGIRSNNDAFTWNMPGRFQVHAMNMTPGEDTQYWNFWVQKESLMYCPFSVSIGGDYDPEGDPDFERTAWYAYHDSVLVLGAMEEPAYIAATQVEAENLAREAELMEEE